MAKHRPGEVRAARLLDALNERIVNEAFRIGPSYLMRPWIYEEPDGLEQVWETDLPPLLEENHAGDGTDVRARYGLPALRKAVDIAEPGVEPGGGGRTGGAPEVGDDAPAP